MRFHTETPLRLAPPRGMAIYHPEERPWPPFPAAPMEAMRRKLAVAFDAEVRRMLGLWVSECEPGLAWGPEGLLGLTLTGDPGPARIIVPSCMSTAEGCVAAMRDAP